MYDIKNQKDTVCAHHFNSKGHSLDNFRVQIIEKVMPNDTHTLLEKEKLWIQRLITRIPFGLNSHDLSYTFIYLCIEFYNFKFTTHSLM